MAYVTLGVIILWFGWFGFNPGSTLSVRFGGVGFFAYVAMNTNIAAAAGVLGAVVTSWIVIKKPDLSMMLNGGGLHQLGTQALGLAAVGAFTFGASFLVLLLFRLTVGIRTEPEVESAGLDVSEHGMWGYPEFYIPVPGGYGQESSHLVAHASHLKPANGESAAPDQRRDLALQLLPRPVQEGPSPQGRRPVPALQPVGEGLDEPAGLQEDPHPVLPDLDQVPPRVVRQGPARLVEPRVDRGQPA